MAHEGKRTTVVIVGGGFAGVSTALGLAKLRNPELRIVLISDRPHFEYHATLYRIVVGHSPLEVCVPLREIFAGYDVELIEDFIGSVDPKVKSVKGSSGFTYSYDYLVLALGSETAYFHIPGLDKWSLGFKSIIEALRLKRRIQETLHNVEQSPAIPLHCVVVGGGASGVELAGELVGFLRHLAKEHKLDISRVMVDLVEAAPRVLPGLPADISAKVEQRLREIGVNIHLNSKVSKEDVKRLYLEDMEINSRLVIWTAGVTPNRLYGQIEGLHYDKRGRVEVDTHLRAKGHKDIFIGGDAASTQFSGMAQTALHDGSFIADIIVRDMRHQHLPAYVPHQPIYAIPVGPGWAAALIKGVRFYGSFGWFWRKVADLRFFLTILPFGKAYTAFHSDRMVSESCPICASVSSIPNLKS